ncbi:sodium-independent anion transporter [Marinomonas rhodophyticola]|uniref:Sodium-independent anion transporter n=2 Tax=Marinomonas TaxID=28253 RepID=A0ABT3KNC5_9GAMM|nr:sodium-independent anion transporter [Marinomonas sp. KJ51-3]MCW4631681.1 sodium-independent anion transporter [Marinomonas sp. KJ51-3]
MIFGASKAIAKHHNRIHNYKAVVLDLSAVPMMDLTIGLALENAIKDAIDANCAVYIFSPNGQTTERLEKLGILSRLPHNAFCDSRKSALAQAVESLKDA